MNQNSRVQATIRNAIFGVAGQIFIFTLQFVSRTIFIRLLGVTYLGLNGLFSNILSVLSLAELGVGYAITFSLYKPLAEKDTYKIQALMNLYKKIYQIIGAVVLVLGLSLIPFLDHLIADKPDIPHLTFIYLLFLLNSVVSYFFVYKRSIIIADQKNYIVTIQTNLFALITNIIQIVVLIIWNNFIIYLLVQIVTAIIANITISKKADQLYPYLKGKNSAKLDKDSRIDIIKKMKAMAYHQIGQVLVLGTDNLLISSFAGIFYVGLYSNYLMILNVISKITSQLLNSATASIGNLTASEGLNKNFDVFEKLFYGTFYIYGICSICLFALIGPFISLWVGSEYVLSESITILIVLNFYLGGMRLSVLSYRNALGLFYQDRYKPLFETLINLISSIVLMKMYGLIGVFMGTFISTVTTSVWVEPYILYKHYFKKSLREYFKKYLVCLLVTFGTAWIVSLVVKSVFTGTWISFIIVCFMTVAISLTVFFILFGKTESFKYYIKIARKILLKIPVVLKTSN